MNQDKLNWLNFKDSDLDFSQGTSSIRNVLSDAVKDGFIPGAVFTLAYHGKIIVKEVIGNRQVLPDLEPMTHDTIFDLASLTKVVATWPAILILLQNRLIELNTPITEYLPQVENSSLAETTIVDLLTHTSGLPERTFLRHYGPNKQDIIQGIADTGLEAKKGERVLYSNRGFILLGHIIEEISRQRLDEFVTENVWKPLQMMDTFFTPPASMIPRIAPTEFREELGHCQRGTAHDENAAWLGGVAGHAGAFSTMADLSRFCAILLAGGKLNNLQVFDDTLIDQSFINYTGDKNEPRGLAWEMHEDLNCPTASWGHTGFTGTSIWINPELDAFGILLTNRIHPSRENPFGIRELRKTIRNKCWDIIQNQE